MSLPALLAQAEATGDGFRLTIPEDWHQGRTAYGGFSSALALSAAQAAGGDLPPLRSAQVSMIAPLSGEVEVRARLLRPDLSPAQAFAEIRRAKDVFKG